MSIKFLRRLVLLAVLAAAVGAGLYYYRDKTYLRVASGPERGELYKIVGAFQQALNEDGHRIRIRRVVTETARDAREAFDEKKVDLAILRADQEQPRNAETIALVRRDFVFLIAPPKVKIESFKDLSGKTVGLLANYRSDEKVLDALLTYYNIEPGKVTRIPVDPANAGAMAAQKKFAALFVVGQIGMGPAQEAFSAIGKATKASAQIVAIEEAEAIAKIYPYFDTTEIPKGAFGGASPQPEEAATTLTLGYRLLTRRETPTLITEKLARMIMEHKPRMAALMPAASQIEAPETGKDAYFHVHRGAANYFDGEETSLFDRFESLFYIGAALLSLAGSLGAWIMSRVRQRKGEDPEQHVTGALDLALAARDADSAALDALEAKAEEQLRWALTARVDGKLGDEEFGAFEAALQQARRAMDLRRAKLSLSSA